MAKTHVEVFLFSRKIYVLLAYLKDSIMLRHILLIVTYFKAVIHLSARYKT